MRTLIAAAAAGCFVSVTAVGQAEQATTQVSAEVSRPVTFDIPAQPISTALKAFAEQTALQLIFTESDVGASRTSGIKGELSPTVALAEILKGTDLEYRITASNVVVVRKAGMGEKTSNSYATRGRLKLARAEQPDSDSSGSMRGQTPDGVEEVIVTATKRAERIQDVPMSITAIGAQDISHKNLLTMNDYLRTVPGVNMIDLGSGRNTIIMRGITADPQYEEKSVGAYFGEVPVAGLSQRVNDGGSADFMMVDIARVEVLRGPQGTLYGSGSMGGTVRVIPNSPDLHSMEGAVQVGYSNTSGEGGPSNRSEGHINLPLMQDKLALRAVAYRFDTSGYIRNVAETSKAQALIATGATARNRSDIGATLTEGFRGSLLWKVTDAFEIELMHASQDTEVEGRPDVDLTLGAYEQDRFTTPFGEEGIEDRISASNVLLRYDFGWSTLLSSSSWTSATGASNRNFGGGFWEITPVAQRIAADTDTFTQEVRLTSNLDGRFQFVAGGYYEDRDVTQATDNRWGGSQALQAANGFGIGQQLGAFVTDESVEQKAVFGEASIQITDQLSVTGGARVFQYDRSSDDRVTTAGFFTGYQVLDPDEISSDEEENSYKVNVSYQPSEDQLIYLQWSEGFRLGYPLAPVRSGSGCDLNGDGVHDDLGLPFGSQINSDFLENTELGAKLSALDRRLTVNFAAYHIKWKGLPVFVGAGSPCGGPIALNAGSAKSQGIELESSFYATPNLRFDIGASIVNAELTSDVLGFAEAGDRLPGSPKRSFNVGMEYGFTIGEHTGYVRGDAAYVGGFYGNLQGLGTEAGDYYQVNLKSGMKFGSLAADVFVNNLTNSDELIWVDLFDPTAYRMRPRTVGMNLTYGF